MDIYAPTISKSMRFRPHYNIAIGRYIYTKDDYLKAMNKLGLEPQRSAYVKDYTPKPYTPTPWAREMINQLKNCPKDWNGNPQLGNRFWDSIRNHGGKDLKDLPTHVRQQLSTAVGECYAT